MTNTATQLRMGIIEISWIQVVEKNTKPSTCQLKRVACMSCLHLLIPPFGSEPTPRRLLSASCKFLYPRLPVSSIFPIFTFLMMGKMEGRRRRG